MYVYNAELLCNSCGAALAERLRAEGVADGGDSDGFPQHANDGGESDGPNHCPSGDGCLGDVVDLTNWGLPEGAPLYGAETRRIGELLDERLTSEGVSYLKELLGDDECEFTQVDVHEWRCLTHGVVCVQSHEPVMCPTGREDATRTPYQEALHRFWREAFSDDLS